MPVKRDLCAKIGEMKPLPSSPDSEWIRCVQAEEPDTRLAVVFDVEAQVAFWEGRDPGQVGKRASGDALHPEGHQADPGRALELLDSQPCWHERLQRCDRDRPVGKEQVAPGLPPAPAMLRDRPGPMVESRECGVQRALLKGRSGSASLGWGRRSRSREPDQTDARQGAGKQGSPTGGRYQWPQ